MPTASPASLRTVNRSPSQIAPSTALNSGAVALRIAEYDAGSVSAAQPNSTNGIAEFTTPITA